MANAVAINDSPLKGISPVPANAIVTAHDHMSAAVVTRVPASCSGAINAGVPTVTWPEGPMVVIPGTAASPKSISTGPWGPSRTLAGLKSRCTIPAACTAPSAASVTTAMRSSAAPVRGLSCSTTSTSDGPLTYSLTMNGRRSKIPVFRTCAVQNRATRCAAATFFRKRLRTCGSVVGGRSFTAARLPVGPTARNTTPCPPSPRRPSSRYPPTSRGSVSRRASISGIAYRPDVTRPFCPLAAHRAPRFRFLGCLPQFPTAASASGGTAVLRPRPPGAAPDLSTGITEVLVTGQTSTTTPGRRIGNLFRRASEMYGKAELRSSKQLMTCKSAHNGTKVPAIRHVSKTPRTNERCVLCTLLAGRRLEHDHQFSGYAAAVYEAMERSRLWHAAFDRIEHGRIPVVAALHGAVIGGGLELALTAHVRVADRT